MCEFLSPEKPEAGCLRTWGLHGTMTVILLLKSRKVKLRVCHKICYVALKCSWMLQGTTSVVSLLADPDRICKCSGKCRKMSVVDYRSLFSTSPFVYNSWFVYCITAKTASHHEGRTLILNIWDHIPSYKPWSYPSEGYRRAEGGRKRN
jgi:hypothetical protein